MSTAKNKSTSAFKEVALGENEKLVVHEYC
jgi:hypothetical protein